MPKQATQNVLSVSFDTDLDQIEQIEFVFTQDNKENAPTLKSALWVNGGDNTSAVRVEGENVIEIPWSIEDTFKFKREKKFFMDTRIAVIGDDYNPITPIIELFMCPSLFKQSEVITDEEEEEATEG